MHSRTRVGKIVRKWRPESCDCGQKSPNRTHREPGAGGSPGGCPSDRGWAGASARHRAVRLFPPRVFVLVQGVLLGLTPCTENLHPKGPERRLGVQGVLHEITPCTNRQSSPRRTPPKNTLSGPALAHKILTVNAISETLCSEKDKEKLLTNWF